MDHSHMDHGDMDHGDGGHGGHEMPMMCNMNMLFTWDTNNLCIIFRQWRVTGTWSLISSLLIIVAICAGYEVVREATRRYELWLTSGDGYTCRSRDCGQQQSQENVTENSSLLGTERIGGNNSGGPASEATISQRARIVKAVLYAVQTFYAFMIMLLFMTYNGYVMIAVTVGAGLGFYFFGSHTRGTKETACH
ncbi:Ctr copper transporter family-domain-containing protein [Xylariaceae sp. FL1272]|nr:Ctr copper transporter family-domain-containing protein [Xylariaceae sp. FL1272]